MPDGSRCGRIMVGSGTDAYDPTCDLPEGHKGVCKSVGATDQHHITSGDLNRIYAEASHD
jgi:hypothetical protein